MISRTTLWRRAAELGIATRYSQLSADELDAVVRKITRESPNSGIIMVWGQLRGYGIKVTREKVRQFLDRISPSAIAMRRTRTISRRVYSVPSSNALWHIDGLHCLIRWRIVLHGGIDGYSQQVANVFTSVVKQPSHHCFGVVLDSNQKVWVAIKGEI